MKKALATGAGFALVIGMLCAFSPTRELAQMALGKKFDLIAQGTTPSAAQQPLCSTSSTAALFENPAACGLPSFSSLSNEFSLTGSSHTSPALSGFVNGSSTSAARWNWGDNGASLMQAAYSERPQFFSYHGFELWGAQASTTPPAFSVGGGSADWGLEVHSGGGNGLKVDGSGQYTGLLEALGSFSVAGTASIPHGSIQSVTFQNGWSNFGSGFQTAGYYKDAEGIVHLEGLIHGGTISTATDIAVFTLASGFRPTAELIFGASSNNAFGEVRVSPAGLVAFYTPATNTWVSIDGLTFRTN